MLNAKRKMLNAESLPIMIASSIGNRQSTIGKSCH
jgi:hypothetical protein